MAADLVISVSIDASGTKSGASEAKRAVQSVANVDFSALSNKLKEVGSAVRGVGLGLTAAVTAPLIGLATLALSFTAMRQRAELSFKVLLKDGEKAKALMRDLTEFSDKTPFESQEIIDAGRKLVAFGVDATQVKSILTDLGDTAAAMEVNVVDVANAFGRLKAGDFGEAFERFRDFGISREALEGKGLKFDKSGQFKGSVEQAMEAVRAVMKEKFGGTMDELSNSISGKFSTVVDKAKGLLIKLFEPAQPVVSQQLDNLINIIQRVVQYFEQASPQVRVFILTIAAIAAAAGPVLVVIGTLITLIGSFVGAIATIAGAWTAATAAVTAAGGIFAFLGTVITGTVLPALAAAAPVILAVVAVIGTLIAVGAVLIAAYQTNFGGFRDFVNEVFTTIQQTIESALAAIQNYWTTYGDSILTTATSAFQAILDFVEPIVAELINFWREELQTILEVAKPLLAQLSVFFGQKFQEIKAVVLAVLSSISAFWQSHGEQIKSIVSSIWAVVKTVVLTGIRQIANVVTLVLAVINGDWSAAWQAFKNIVKAGIDASVAILRSLGNIVYQLLKAVVTRVYEIGADFLKAGREIGGNIVQGIVNGIKSGAGAVASAAWNLGKRAAIGSLAEAVDSHSPSREAHKIGGYVGEGLALGIESKSARVKTAAKRIADDTLKQLNDARKEFEKLAGSSPERIGRINQTADLQDAKSKLEEIIRLRRELNAETGKPLPVTLADINAELKGFEQIKRNLEDAKNLIESLTKTEVVRTNLEQLNAALANPAVSAELEARSRALGVTVEQFKELLKLRAAAADLKIAGSDKAGVGEFGDAGGRPGFVKFSEDLKTLDLYSSTLDELNGKMRQSAEVTELDRIQKMLLREEYQNLTPEMRKAVEEKAREVDEWRRQQKAIEEAKQNIAGYADFVEEKLTILIDKGWKEFFSSILGDLKRFLVRAASEWLASKFYKLISGQNDGAESGGGVGGLFQKIFGGGGGTGNSSGGSSAGGGILSAIRNLFGGGSSRSTSALSPAQMFGDVGGRPGSGVPSASGGSGLAGTLGTIGALATLGGSLVGGRVGGAISGAGQGLALGASIGSIVPGIGTAIGAAVGAVAGGLFSLFSDKKRKADAKQNLPALQKGFGDALQQMRDLVEQAKKSPYSFDIDGALNKAKELKDAVASGFNIRFESKKYKKIAAQQIAAKTAEANGLYAELQELAASIRDMQAARAERQSLIPEFATGTYISPAFRQQFTEFKRRNGMLPGIFTGRDSLPSMLAPGEMVLNPQQIAAVIQNAGGFDVFRNAKIPGYRDGVFVQPAPIVSTPAATSASSSSDTFEFNFEINNDLPATAASEMSDAQFESKFERFTAKEKGKTVIVNVLKRIRADRQS